MALIWFSISNAHFHIYATEIDTLSIQGALKEASNPDDSIKILYNFYDVGNKEAKRDVGMQILDIATRINNKEVILDLLNQLASGLDDADALDRLLKASNSLPEEDDRRSTELLLQMEQAKTMANKTSDSAREKQYISYAQIDVIGKDDIYEEILNIYRAMVYLGPTAQGALYLDYITRLENLVKQLPPDDFAIRNLFYTTAAVFYTRTRDYKKAIEFDKALISQIQNLEKKYKEMGRNNYNFGYFYYVSYRRMLQNFRGLTPEEIEKIYLECVDLAENNTEVQEAFDEGGLTKSYYYFATERYKEAVPFLRKALVRTDISRFRRQELLGLLSKALRQTGDSGSELIALREYTDMLEEDRAIRRENAYKELEIKNSVRELRQKDKLAEEKLKSENRRMRRISMTLVYVLALILIFLCRSYFKLKDKVRRLESQNTSLHTNIAHMLDDGRPHGSKSLKKNE